MFQLAVCFAKLGKDCTKYKLLVATVYIFCSDGMSTIPSSVPFASPLATRVLELHGFSPAIRTRDLHMVLEPWSYGEPPAYRIKWQDDATAYILFQDASVAKQVYLSLLCAPPDVLRVDFNGTELYDTSRKTCGRMFGVKYAQIRPFHGPEAQALLSNANMLARDSTPQLSPLPWASPSMGISVGAGSNLTLGNAGAHALRGAGSSRAHRRIASSTALPSSSGDAPALRVPRDNYRGAGRRAASASISGDLGNGGGMTSSVFHHRSMSRQARP